ncbi:ATP-binding protein [Legionella fallonii]|uniref:histidine kinase n=1 Tax=Legionella fallonii LLAP-10 TaxID=1212491 RepID=A0A098G2F6_9GAMM|nr:ATP-binding protein [Legionella fallonii]CEG56166.1 Aerobic respiration control sensor protein ArcB [Legionella fallonii LLAP-10]
MTKPNSAHKSCSELEYKKTIQKLNHKIEELSAENFQLKNLVDTLPGDIYWKDTKGVWLGLNTRCVESLYRLGFINEIDKKQVIGKTDYQLFDQKSASGYRQTELEVMKKGAELSREELAHLPSGEIVTLLSTKRPLWDKDGKIIGIIGNTIDISRLKKIEMELHQAKEAAEVANHAKTAFLANMRHDIRTPLSGIVGFSEIIKSESTEPNIKEHAANLVASSHALLDLLDEVLEAVKISSGEIPLLKRKFNLVQNFEHITALYSAKAQEKGLNLSFTIDDSLPKFVIGDKIRVHRIVLELVGNALNFTQVGHVTIAVILAKREHRNLTLKITVTDSGIGIPQEKQQEVYIQFNRLTPSYQGIYKGSGLGLYIVKKFIEELGGEIYVESELDKGTCFTCLIPVQEPLLDDDSGIDKTEYSKTKPIVTPPVKSSLNNTATLIDTNTTSEKVQVLVVEDNQVAQSIAKTLLATLSCHVDIAANGNEALTLYAKRSYDLIFMDIGLGEGMDGYEVSRQIKNMSNKPNSPPIIALSAHEDEENKQRSIEAGMTAVLTKPLTQAKATEILKQFITSSNATLPKDNVAIGKDLPNTDAELFQLEQYALLDTEQALKNCGSMSLLIQLLTVVSQDVPANLIQMKKAYENQDYPSVEKIAHYIKGSAVYVGTIRMKYACQYVERYWKSGERKFFDKLYHQAVRAIEESCNYIKDWLQKNQK